MGYQESLIKPIGKGFTFNKLISDIEKIYKSEVDLGRDGWHLSQCDYAIITFKKQYEDIKKGTKFLLIFGERWVQNDCSYLSNKPSLDNYDETEEISEEEIFKYSTVKPHHRKFIIDYYDKYMMNLDQKCLEYFSDIIKNKETQDLYWDIKYLEFDGNKFVEKK